MNQSLLISPPTHTHTPLQIKVRWSMVSGSYCFRSGWQVQVDRIPDWFRGERVVRNAGEQIPTQRFYTQVSPSLRIGHCGSSWQISCWQEYMNIVEICAAEDSVSASYKGGISGHLLSMELICYLAPSSPKGSVQQSHFLIQTRPCKYLLDRYGSLNLLTNLLLQFHTRWQELKKFSQIFL